MLPQIIVLIFAFTIRKIKIKGLDDAKYIAFAVYITSLVTAIVIVITYTLDMYHDLFASIFSTGFFIGTTSILFLVLMPPVSCCLFHSLIFGAICWAGGRLGWIQDWKWGGGGGGGGGAPGVCKCHGLNSFIAV